jgi:hypothetical protein
VEGGHTIAAGAGFELSGRRFHPLLLSAALLVSAGSITSGYLVVGYWMVLPALLGMGLLYLLARRGSVFRAASVLLLGAIVLSAIGIMARLALSLMLVGCTSALAAWDLMLFQQKMRDIEDREGRARLEQYHIRSLAIALAAGCVLSLAAGSITLNLPFAVVLLLCTLAIGGLFLGIHVSTRNE